MEITEEAHWKIERKYLFPGIPYALRSHYGRSVEEAVKIRAKRLVASRLKAMGWTQKDLAMRRKEDRKKVKLAAEVRTRTNMPLAWIAERLVMGIRGYLTPLIT